MQFQYVKIYKWFPPKKLKNLGKFPRFMKFQELRTHGCSLSHKTITNNRNDGNDQ